MPAEPSTLEGVLAAVRDEVPGAIDRLAELIYEDLREVAKRMTRRERPGSSVPGSVLIQETFLKLLSNEMLRTAQSRDHLYAAAVQAMRQILIDRHRARTAKRRGGKVQRRHLLDVVIDRLVVVEKVGLLELNDALEGLASVDPRAGLVASYHILMHMSLPEVADSLDISIATAERDWQFGRAWLRKNLKPHE